MTQSIENSDMYVYEASMRLWFRSSTCIRPLLVCKSVAPETSTVTEHAAMIRPTAEQLDLSPPGMLFVSHVADDRAISTDVSHP